MREEEIYSVSQVNQYVRGLFEREAALRAIYVRGEVSNCTYHGSGHIYFTLKDAGGQISCVMFAGQRSGLAFPLREGQSVIVLGSVSLYEKGGKYQLYAREIVLDGKGALYEQYEQRKAKLEREGLFLAERKKAIPFYSRRIGIVTAETGAAIHDIVNISRRRNPYAQLILYPAKVQGEGAKEAIVSGIRALDRLGVDVIIVGRGGGSIEDLWAFNEEEVARAIFACKTPIISAVGHETDTTIADYVADLRAPTPSAAAELAVCSVLDLENQLMEWNHRMNRQMKRKVNLRRQELEACRLRLRLQSPESQILQRRQRLSEMEDRMRARMSGRIEDGRRELLVLGDRMRARMDGTLSGRKHAVALLAARLKGLSPLSRLEGGFGYVTDGHGAPVRSAGGVAPGDAIRVTLSDGHIDASVTQVTHAEKEDGAAEDSGREEG